MEEEILTELNKLPQKYLLVRNMYKRILKLIRNIKSHKLNNEELNEMTTLEFNIKMQANEMETDLLETFERAYKLL